MARLDSFTFRVNQDERQMLEQLSANLQRSQSDAVRLLIREAVKQLPGLFQGEGEPIGNAAAYSQPQTV